MAAAGVLPTEVKLMSFLSLDIDSTIIWKELSVQDKERLVDELKEAFEDHTRNELMSHLSSQFAKVIVARKYRTQTKTAEATAAAYWKVEFREALAATGGPAGTLRVPEGGSRRRSRGGSRGVR